MTLEATEKECTAVSKALRVSLADIESAIGEVYHLTGDRALANMDVPARPPGHALERLSICLLVMRNGFTIIGKSAPASAENFNADLGRKLAYEDAVRQLWPLMGFALPDKLAASA